MDDCALLGSLGLGLDMQEKNGIHESSRWWNGADVRVSLVQPLEFTVSRHDPFPSHRLFVDLGCVATGTRSMRLIDWTDWAELG